MEFQLLDVAKMVRRIAARITAGQINEVQHAGIVSICAPIFRDTRKQVSVKRQPLLRSCIFTEESRVKILSQFGGRAITVQPKPSILIQDESMSAVRARS